MVMLRSRWLGPRIRLGVIPPAASFVLMCLAYGQATGAAMGSAEAVRWPLKISLEVDARHVVKDVSRVRRGILLSPKTTDYVLTKYAREAGMAGALVRIPLDFGWMPNPGFVDPLIEKVKRRGGEPLIFVVGVPPVLARTNVGLVQGEQATRFDLTPKNLAIWQDMVRRAVTHFNKDKGYGIKYFEIWNEPDAANFWSGTEEEYFELFRASVKGALSADHSIKIGGPAVASWRGEIGGGGPLLKKLLAFAKAQGLPLDFLSWHAFENDPYTLTSVVRRIKSWRDETGFRHAELFLNEWNHPGGAERDGPVGAAHAGAMLSAIFASDVDRQAFAMLQDGDTSKTDFSGNDFGAFTVTGIAKAAFNAMAAAALLGDTQLGARQDGGQQVVASVATKGPGFVAIMIAYSPPDPLAAATNFLFAEGGYTEADLRGWGWNKAKTEQFRRGQIDGILAGLRAPPAAIRDLTRALALRQAIAEQIDGAPRDVDIVVKGLDKGSPWVYERYLIDGRHSNGVMVRDQISSRLQALRLQAREEGLRRAEAFLTREGSILPDSLQELLRAIRGSGPDETERHLLAFKRTASAPAVRSLRQAEKIFQEATVEGLQRGLDDINGWPQVRLAPIEQGRSGPVGEFRKTVRIEPFSVTLFLLKRQDHLSR